MLLRRTVLPAIVAAALMLGLSFAATAQPAYKPQHGSEILWDKWGVPHIFAKNTRDMFYLYGYAQAEAHGDLLMRSMAGSRGKSSEIYGPGDGDRNLKNDRWVLLNEVPQRAQLWLSKQTPEFRGYLEAFAAGINAYGKAHPDKLTAESKQVLPLSALDILQHEEHVVNFEFVAGRTLMEPRTTTAAAVEEPESPFAPTNMDMQEGSNGWAIAPSHTTGGNAMLLMNPHLAMGGEQTYFEVHLTAPGINLYGATWVGFPVLRFCFSDYVAITNTVNTNNGALLYKITEKDGGYLYDGKVMKYETAQYPFRIKQRGRHVHDRDRAGAKDGAGTGGAPRQRSAGRVVCRRSRQAVLPGAVLEDGPFAYAGGVPGAAQTAGSADVQHHLRGPRRSH